MCAFASAGVRMCVHVRASARVCIHVYVCTCVVLACRSTNVSERVRAGAHV